jgi:DNA polymerase II small subunit/DNA polymerase delta subunit B
MVYLNEKACPSEILSRQHYIPELPPILPILALIEDLHVVARVYQGLITAGIPRNSKNR